jgi:hypothetical protein
MHLALPYGRKRSPYSTFCHNRRKRWMYIIWMIKSAAVEGSEVKSVHWNCSQSVLWTYTCWTISPCWNTISMVQYDGLRIPIGQQRPLLEHWGLQWHPSQGKRIIYECPRIQDRMRRSKGPTLTRWATYVEEKKFRLCAFRSSENYVLIIIVDSKRKRCCQRDDGWIFPWFSNSEWKESILISNTQ